MSHAPDELRLERLRVALDLALPMLRPLSRITPDRLDEELRAWAMRDLDGLAQVWAAFAAIGIESREMEPSPFCFLSRGKPC